MTNELRKLLASASPGPWAVSDCGEWVVADNGQATICKMPWWPMELQTEKDANAALVAAAVNALPELLDRIAYLEAEVARLK
jgi:hypothetical protein